jgi:hypothetical protein
MNKQQLLTMVFLFTGFVAQAQKDLPSDTFRVVKAYQPTLVDADKIMSEPEIVDTFKLETELDYQFFGKQMQVSYKPELISAAKIKGEPLVRLYSGYARAAVGNTLLPLAELSYTNRRSDKYALGGHFKYINQRELSNYKSSGLSQTHFEVFGKRFWKTNTLEGNISYDIDAMNYYGYYQMPRLVQDELASEAIEQQYNRLGAQFKLKSTKQDSFNLRHEVKVAYQMTTNKAGNQENYFKAKGKLSQFKNAELYQLDLLVDYNKYELSEESAILAMQPQISTIGERFRVNAGLGIYMNAGPNDHFHFYPLAEVKYNVIENILVPYAGIKGEVKRNNYSQITRENPFVGEKLQLENSNQKHNIYLGVRGTLSKKVSFNTSAAKISTENDYLYVKRPAENLIQSKEFYLTYDKIDELKFKGELVYRLDEKIKVYALGEYIDYETRNEEEAWHRPKVKVNTTAEYNLGDKLIARLDLFYWGEQYAQRVTEITTNQDLDILDRQYGVETLAPIFDVNLGVEYRYTKKISAFIQFNNIGGINYEKYQDYPLQGFNVFGGLTYGF